MIAKLWADNIISGKKKIDQVPRQLKVKVAEILKERGYEELTTE